MLESVFITVSGEKEFRYPVNITSDKISFPRFSVGNDYTLGFAAMNRK